MIVKESKHNAMNTPETRDLKSAYAPASTGPGVQPYYAGYMTASPPPASPPMYGAAPLVMQNPFVPYGTDNRRKTRRFCHAIAIVLFVWVLLTLLVRSSLDLHITHRFPWRGGLAKDYPEFDRGEALQCVERPDWTISTPLGEGMPAQRHRPPHHSRTTFSLPASADLLYFISRGSLAEGNVHITLASPPTVDDGRVQVDVTVYYWKPEALERASVCALEKHDDGDQYGVGIFTPRSWPGRPRTDRLYFDVVVRLPLGAYKALHADYENFSLRIANLQGSVVFDKVYLKTSNNHVYAESLETLEGTVKSSNGPISGRYNVTDSLELVTSNSPIDTVVDMHSADSHVTSLFLKTSNGHIRSELFLYGPPVTSAFDVQAITSNSPADIRTVTQPHSSPLTLDVRTSNAPAVAVLHPAFEGPFTLRTSAFLVPVLRYGDNDIEDPSGEGRTRSVQVEKQVRSVLEGKVWWGEWTNKGKGWVHVSSSNSPVELNLVGKGTL